MRAELLYTDGLGAGSGLAGPRRHARPNRERISFLSAASAAADSWTPKYVAAETTAMIRIPILPRDPRFTKLAIERRKFEMLAPLVGWQVVPGSIQQPNPPQPDLLCDVGGVGPLAVELVSLDDPATRRRLQNMFNTNHAWACALNVWSPVQQRVLLAHLGDAFITPQFHNEADVQARAQALYALQQLLFSNLSRRGRIGPDEIGNPLGFECAHIHRGSVTNGPQLQTS